MGILYISLAASFVVLLIVNLAWIIVNLYMFVVVGLESIIAGQTLIENIYYSKFVKWIIISDVVWIGI